MQFAPTLTADNGTHTLAARVGNHFNSPIQYPASFPAPGGGLIFFCALFLYQDKKRVWGMGGKAPHDNGPRPSSAPVGNHFNGPIPYPASFPAPGGGLIFFCTLFLYQDKKRVWGIGGKAPYDNSPRTQTRLRWKPIYRPQTTRRPCPLLVRAGANAIRPYPDGRQRRPTVRRPGKALRRGPEVQGGCHIFAGR